MRSSSKSPHPPFPSSCRRGLSAAFLRRSSPVALVLMAVGLLVLAPEAIRAQGHGSAGLSLTYASNAGTGAGAVSLWAGVRPGALYYAPSSLFDVSIGVEIAPVGLGPRIRPGRRLGHRYRYDWWPRYGYSSWWPCAGLYWDPWYGYGPACEPVWVPVPAYRPAHYAWSPYRSHRYHYDRFGYWGAHAGISFGVHFSFGNYYAPTVWVDPVPRWVVRPAVTRSPVRVVHSTGPGLGGGGWVTRRGPEFKEDPAPPQATTRTAVRRTSLEDDGSSVGSARASIGTGRAAVAATNRAARSAPASEARAGSSTREVSGSERAAPSPRRSAPAATARESPGDARSGSDRTPVQSWYAPVRPQSSREADADRGAERRTADDRRGSAVRSTPAPRSDRGGATVSGGTSDESSTRVRTPTPGDRTRTGAAPPRTRSSTPTASPSRSGPSAVTSPRRSAPEAQAPRGSDRRVTSTPSRPQPRSGASPQRSASPQPRASSRPSATVRPAPSSRAPSSATGRSGGRATSAPAPSRSTGRSQARGGG